MITLSAAEGSPAIARSLAACIEVERSPSQLVACELAISPIKLAISATFLMRFVAVESAKG